MFLHTVLPQPSLADPWANLFRWKSALDRWDRDLIQEDTVGAVNLWVDEEKAIVEVALPGVDPNEVAIQATHHLLVIEAQRTATEASEGETLLRSERPVGKIRRSVRWPYPVESEAIEADYANGILTITAPRANADKPRRIAVKSH